MKDMDTKDEPKYRLEDIAIARAVFCWETEAWSGRVLHYYGDKDGNLISYPTPQEIAAYNNKKNK